MTNAAAKTPAKVTIDCDRCDGKGYLHGMSHYAAGRCFLCAGSGQRKVTPYVENVAHLDAAAIAVRAEMAERAVKSAAFVATFAGLDAATIADRFVNLSDAKVCRLYDVAYQLTSTGAAELCEGAAETLYRRGLLIRRAA